MFKFSFGSNLALNFGFRGAHDMPQNGCAAGAMAIGKAFREIKHGYLDAAVAGGVDLNAGTKL